MRALIVTLLTHLCFACGANVAEGPDALRSEDADAAADGGSPDGEPAQDASVDATAGPDVESAPDSGEPNPEPSWAPTTGSPPSSVPGRWGATLVHDTRDGRLILYGGSHYPSGTAGDTWAFDLEAQTWSELETQDPPAARFCHCASYLPETHEVLVVNGRDDGGAVEHAAFTLSLDTLAWTRVDSVAPSGQVGCNAIYDPMRERVVIFGGAGAAGFVGSTWLYDPQTRVFAELETTRAPSPRRDAMLVRDPDSGRLLLFGGQTGRSSHAQDVWAFDGADWEELPVEGTRPSARRWGASALGADGQWLIFGGTNETESFEDLWRFDLDTARFEPLEIEPGPRARAGAAHAFVVARGELFVFGGFEAATYAKYEDGWTLSF